MTAATVEWVTLRGPRTIHLVRRQLQLVPAAIETWCGLYGIPHAPTVSATRECRRCQTNKKGTPE